MPAIQDPCDDTIFSACVADAFDAPDASLARLSGYRMPAPEDLRTTVTLTVEQAWDTPLGALTCEQVRMLVSQTFGLEWLARAVVRFVEAYPRATITFYPGDLTLAVLRAYAEIKALDPEAAQRLAGVDYSWMAQRYAFSEDLSSEAQRLVARVVAPAGSPGTA